MSTPEPGIYEGTFSGDVGSDGFDQIQATAIEGLRTAASFFVFVASKEGEMKTWNCTALAHRPTLFLSEAVLAANELREASEEAEA